MAELLVSNKLLKGSVYLLRNTMQREWKPKLAKFFNINLNIQAN